MLPTTSSALPAMSASARTLASAGVISRECTFAMWKKMRAFPMRSKLALTHAARSPSLPTARAHRSAVWSVISKSETLFLMIHYAPQTFLCISLVFF